MARRDRYRLQFTFDPTIPEQVAVYLYLKDRASRTEFVTDLVRRSGQLDGEYGIDNGVDSIELADAVPGKDPFDYQQLAEKILPMMGEVIGLSVSVAVNEAIAKLDIPKAISSQVSTSLGVALEGGADELDAPLDGEDMMLALEGLKMFEQEGADVGE